MATTLTQVSWARYDDVQGHLTNTTMALDRALHVPATRQCCSALYCTSQNLSLLRIVGCVLCVSHKATTVEQDVRRWEPEVSPARALEVYLHTFSGLAAQTQCSLGAGVGCHELCSWCASSRLALPTPRCPVWAGWWAGTVRGSALGTHSWPQTKG